MFALDLFNNDHERRLAEGAVDTLEQRRIDDLAMKMDELVARAKTATTPEAKQALMKEFQKCKDERDSYYHVKEGGIPGNVPAEKIPGKEDLLKGKGRSYYEEGGIPGSVPTEKIPGKEDLLKGKGRSYYEADQKKNSEDPKLARLKTRARHEHPQAATDDEALALHILDKEQSDVNQLHHDNEREDRMIARLDDLEKNLQQQINQLVQGQNDYVDEDQGAGQVAAKAADDAVVDTMDEGFQDFNKVEPYYVCIGGKPWKKFDYYEDARRAHDNLKKKWYKEGNPKYDTVTLMPVMDEAISKKDLLGKLAKDLNTPFKKAKAGKLKSNGKDFTKGDHWTGPDKDDPSYTRNFGHGYPDTPSNRSHDRYVNKSLKKDVDEADETSWTANSAQFRREEELSWPVEITLEPKDDINRGRGAQVKTMTVTGQSRDAAKKKLVDYFRKNGWVVTGIKFTGDLAEDWIDDEEESELQNGSYVVDTQDHTGEVYRVSQYEPGARRCWIGDRDGRGWYISPDRLEIVNDPGRIRNYFGKRMDEDQDTSGVEQAILRRIMVAHLDLLKEFGPEKVMQAVEEVAYNVGDVDEIGTSDVSAYVNQVKQILGAV